MSRIYVPDAESNSIPLDEASACVIDDCDKAANGARGWCGMHYQRWRLHGDVQARQDSIFPHTLSMDARAWSDYMAENRRANVAYEENPLALSDCCDADDRRRVTNKRNRAWKLQVQR
jgi:hypothetical protein